MQSGLIPVNNTILSFSSPPEASVSPKVSPRCVSAGRRLEQVRPQRVLAYNCQVTLAPLHLGGTGGNGKVVI